MGFMDTAIAHRISMIKSSLAISIDALSMCRDNMIIHFIHDCSGYFSHRERKSVKYTHKHTELMALEQA
jgi:hypothetical protein